RADFLSLQQKQLAAKEGIQIAKGDYFPSLALTGGYVAGNIPNVVTISNALNIGVGLSYNLAALYKTGSKVKAAKARSEQIRWTVANAGDRLKVEVFKAFEEYQESLRKVSMYKIAVEQSDENYRITKNKYANALETTTNLLEAD